MIVGAPLRRYNLGMSRRIAILALLLVAGCGPERTPSPLDDTPPTSPAVVPPGLTGSTVPAVPPRRADARQNFAPVGVERVQTPADTSAVREVATMRTLLRQGRVREAESVLRASTSQDPIVEYYRGVFDAELGRRREALAHFDAAVAANPDLDRYAGCFRDGYALFDTFQEGKPEFLDVLVSRCLLVGGEVEIARDKLRFVTQRRGDYPDAWMLLGAAELILNHPDAAEAALARTLPTMKPDVYYWMGLAATAQKKFDPALAAFRQAEARGFAPAFRLYEKMGDVEFSRQNYVDAAQAYEKALAACTDVPGCPMVDLTVRPMWLNLEVLNTPEKGLELALRTLQKNRDSAMAENLVGWAYLKLQNLPEAEKHLARGLTLDARLAALHLNMGTLAWLKQDIPAAKRSFLRASQLDVNGGVGARARQYLAALQTSPSP